MSFKKNNAVTGFSFGLVSKTDGSDVTTGTTNGFVTIDGGTQTALTNSPVHEGLGQWSVNLTAAEMNGDIIGLVFTNTAAITKQVTISTEVKLVSELNDFNNTTDQVIVTTNNDKSGYSISGTKTTLDALNDIAATEVVSSGAINTSGGAVSTVTSVTNTTSANVVSISGDTVAADNLESQYDGTGLIGDNYPSSQKQVSSLAVGAGGISTTVGSVTVTTGTQVGTFNNTFALDSAYHTINPVGGVTDFYYEFNVGNNGVGTEIQWDGYSQSNNDTTPVYGWNWVSSSWVQIGSILGANGTTRVSRSYTLTSSMTGTGANAGKVRFRFQSTNADNTNTDRILCQYTALPEQAFVLHSGVAQGGGTNYIDMDATASVINDFYIHSRVIITDGLGKEQENIITNYDGTTKRATVKYAWFINPDTTSVFSVTPAHVHCATSAGGYNDNKVYIDILGGVAGTQIGVNGTIDNPSNNLPDARTLADSSQINSNRFEFVKSTSGVVFDQDYTSWLFTGQNPVIIDVNGFDVSLSSFNSLALSGSCTNNTGIAVYIQCGFANYNCGLSNFVDCGLSGDLTLSQSGAAYTADNLYSNRDLSSGQTPTIVFNSDGVSGISMEGGFTGEFIIKGMKSVDTLKVFGNVRLTLDSTCNGGIIMRGGDVLVIDNSTVSPTFINGVMEDIPNTSEFEARTLPSASYFDFTSDQVIVATNNDKTGYSISGTKTTLDSLNDVSTSDIFTTTLTEDYAADGAEFNLTQGLYLAVQNLQDFVYSGVTQTVRKLDGTTTAATYTLDDAVTPTSKTRAT